jgi:hypothetical protein
MIGQYLSNNNENATVPILQKKLHLNRALLEKLDWVFSSSTRINQTSLQ